MPISDLLGILNQYRGASSQAPPPADVEQHFTQVAQTTAPANMAGVLASAFRSDETPPFPQIIGNLFNNSNGEQRAGILNQLLSAAGPSLLTSGALSHLSGLLGTGGQANVTPEQASQVSPEAVQQLAEHAQQQNPSVVDMAGQFYAQHPTLVKALGAGALLVIMRNLSQHT